MRSGEDHKEVQGTMDVSQSEGIVVSLRTLWRILLRRMWVFFLVVILAVFGSILYVSTVVPQYASSAKLDISPQNSQGGGALSELVQQQFQMDTQTVRMQTEQRIMQSAPVLLQVVRRLGLAQKDPFRHSLLKNPVIDYDNLSPRQREILLREFSKSLSFSLIPGTSIVNVTFQSPDPRLTSVVPNALIDEYIAQDLGDGLHGTQRVSEWLRVQTEDLRRQVEQSAQKLADFQRVHNIIGLDESQNVHMDKLRLLNAQLTDLSVDRIAKESEYRIAQTGNPDLLKVLGNADPQLLNLRNQQVELEAQRDELATRYGNGYPRLQEIKGQLASLQSLIDAELRVLQNRSREEFLAAKSKEGQLRDLVNEEEKAIFGLDERAADYALLRHDAEATRNLYDAVELKLKESGIIDTLQSTRFRIVEEAAVPSTPILPRKGLALTIGLITGVILGWVAAVIVDLVRDSIYSADVLEQRSGVPVVGVVPHLDSAGGSVKTSTEKGLSGSPLSELVNLSDPNDEGAESLRSLRNSMMLGFGSQIAKVQVISSAIQGEGKSLIAANYARVLASSDSSVLLIDADLRRGRTHKTFGIPVSPGLSNYISNRLLPLDLAQPDEQLPNLWVLPRGPIPPNPASLLESKRFFELIEQASSRFDYIVVDCPPIMRVSDALPLAQRADIVLLIARVGVTSLNFFTKLISRLRRLKVPVKGIILNDVTKSLAEYSYYYYGSYDYKEKNTSE